MNKPVECQKLNQINKVIMKNILISALLFFAITSAFTQKKDKDYSEAIKLIEVWLDAQRDFDRLPGISAIVVDDQDVIWSGAFGLANVEQQKKTETTTLCSICSISKLFTSVAIMKLYDEGKLRLDDRVSELLPDYDLEQQFPESGPITIRTLLTHSSGLPREAAYPYWTGPDFYFPSKEEIKGRLGQQETLYTASTYFQYSNLGLTLLGHIVEQVAGQSFDAYVQQHILDPLELTNTRMRMPDELLGNELAVGYSQLDRNGERENLKIFDPNGITPAAGFSSNVGDLGQFASWMLRLRDTNTVEILKPATLKYMQNVHWTDPDWKTTWGLGFVVYKGQDGTTWVGHGGSCPGYRSTLRINLKTKRAYSVMINANGTNPSKYANGIHAILQKVKDSEKEEAEKKDFKDYVGYYSLMPWWSEEYISTWNGKLVGLRLPSEKPEKAMTFYKHIEGDTFRRIRDNKELGETLVFERDEQGKVVRMRRHGNYSQKMDKR